MKKDFAGHIWDRRDADGRLVSLTLEARRQRQQLLHAAGTDHVFELRSSKIQHVLT